MLKNLLFILIFLTSTLSFAQKTTISGKVVDQSTNQPLSFANIRIENTTTGTSANIEGNYLLNLEKGEYKIIASYIGYISDTINVKLTSEVFQNFALAPTPLQLSEVTVFPGTNPALEVIRRAIESKHKRNNQLNSYTYYAFTKGSILTTRDISSNDNSVGLDIGDSDTSKLKISGIIENESKGYFKKPNQKKDEIIARKQSSNFPSTINMLTGGRAIQNFFTDDIQFFGRPLPSPISDNALSYYYFYIEDTLAQDNQTIFQIYFAPDDETDPGFYGRIFITDKSFALAKLNIELNDAANPGGIFTEIKIFQQFQSYNDIYMPIDYRLFVKGNFLGLAKFGFEINTILHNYTINTEIEDDFFNMAVVTVLPDADEKDSTYWQSRQTIPNTLEEVEAYQRIDSLESVPTTFWDRFSFLADRININDNIGMSGPLYIYHFNPIEGHALDFKFYLDDLFKKRFDATFNVGYGFSDHRWKGDFNTTYLFGKYRTGSINFNVFNKLTDLFGESNNYNMLTSTIWSLFSKSDFRDYYYTKGFKILADDEIFPILKLGLGIENRTDNNAYVNTDFSIFSRDKVYRENKGIYETKINSISASFKLDFRNFIEDGYFRRRINRGNYLPVISGELLHSSQNKLKSDLSFDIYKMNLNWRISTIKSAYLSLDINGVYSHGPVPYQMQYALPGNINGGGKNFSFRTLRIGEVYGDQVLSFNFQHEFNDELFRLLKGSWLQKKHMNLSIFFNAAWVDISEQSYSILPINNPQLFKTPFMEIGFGIGQILFPMKIEFAWKLTHKGNNNFVVGINTFAL